MVRTIEGSITRRGSDMSVNENERDGKRIIIELSQHPMRGTIRGF